MMFPTVAEVLELPVLRAGGPVVRAGRSALGRPVRWVHVSEQREPAGTLSGGELVLSIGAAVAEPAAGHRAYVEALREAGAVGLVIELGQHLTSLPATLVDAAREAGLPLVELRSAVRFVEVTETVHARILHEQYARMEFTQRVTEAFRTLMVDGAAVDAVVAEAAALLGAPVVLEDLGHRALAFAGDVAADLLRDWARRSRQAGPSPAVQLAGPEGWSTVPVGPRARRWGRLVVPRRAVGVEQVELVLGQAADAVSVVVRADGRGGRGVELAAQGGLLADILGAGPSVESAARARALGLPTGGAFAVVVLAVGPARGVDDGVLDEVVDDASAVVRRLRLPGLVGPLRPGRLGVVVACRSPADEPEIVERLLGPLAGTAAVVAVAAADAAAAFGELPDALGDALQTSDVAAASPDPAARRVWRPRDLGARGLLWRLRRDPHLLSYVDEQLGPLLGLPEPRRTELLGTLRAHVETGGGMTAFAAQLGISRPAAYDRVRRLARLLDRDLGDHLTRLAVHLALLAHDQVDGSRVGPVNDGAGTD